MKTSRRRYYFVLIQKNFIKPGVSLDGMVDTVLDSLTFAYRGHAEPWESLLLHAGSELATKTCEAARKIQQKQQKQFNLEKRQAWPMACVCWFVGQAALWRAEMEADQLGVYENEEGGRAALCILAVVR